MPAGPAVVVAPSGTAAPAVAAHAVAAHAIAAPAAFRLVGHPAEAEGLEPPPRLLTTSPNH